MASQSSGVGSGSNGASVARVSEKCPFQGIQPNSSNPNDIGLSAGVTAGLLRREADSVESPLCSTARFRVFHAHPKRGPPRSSESSLDV